MTTVHNGARPDDDDNPFEDEHSHRQIAGLVQHLGPESKHVLDLGCGSGRVLVPLAQAGHTCVGLDSDADALQQCAIELQEHVACAELVHADFLEAWPEAIGARGDSFDAVLCLGNTLMTVFDVDQAVQLLKRCAEVLKTGGVIVLDDLARENWPELIEGNWLSGISEDGDAQLVWADDDAVFALRHGAAIDESCWVLRDDDRKLRLWTAGALRLAALAAGLSGPCRLNDADLVLLDR